MPDLTNNNPPPPPRSPGSPSSGTKPGSPPPPKAQPGSGGSAISGKPAVSAPVASGVASASTSTVPISGGQSTPIASTPISNTATSATSTTGAALPGMPGPTPSPASRTVLPPADAPSPSSSRASLVVGIVGFLLLLGVCAWLWTELQDVRHQLAARSDAQIDPARLDGLEGQVKASQQQIDTLTAKVQAPPPAPPPPPPPVDLAPLEARLAALEQRPVPVPPKPVDLGPLEVRLATLEQRPPPDDSAVRARIAELNTRLESVGKQLDAAEAQASQSGARAARAASLQAASLALDDGRPLGDLTGAPAPLQRYATAAPPTEAALRLSFEASAHAAESATDPAAGTADVGERIWQRVQSLVTVRRGDHVLVGDPAAVVLADARRKLVAGDLAGAVAALDRLDPGAAKAMASWRSEAQGLLDARVALAGLTSDSAAKP